MLTRAGQEVIPAANGQGAGRGHGFLVNTSLFDVMLAAMGWKKEN
ncbi:hypothetical protein FHW96_004947 [Novosphingobium sp. SG751A]|nr:hypothetical protein [Novosphingobium sp. SG751A]NOW48757.1 hypothetical protein [Novosphingobium sp. SG751A]